MKHSVFFCYDYGRDRFRVCQVAENLPLIETFNVKGIWDEGSWLMAGKRGGNSLNSMIDRELDGTSVTVVLIGHKTYELDYVDYAISESCSRGNAIVGVKIDKLLDLGGSYDVAGKNPLAKFRINERETLSDIFDTYDWIKDDGETNLVSWINDAIRRMTG